MNFIYVITSNLDDRVYYGMTNDHSERWMQHSTCKDPKFWIDRAIRKHGTEHFHFKVLGQFEERWEAGYVEGLMIDQARDEGRPIYNIADGGQGGGHKGWNPSKKTRERMRAARLGCHNSPNAIEKMKQKLRGRKIPPEQRLRISFGLMGKQNSKGWIPSVETRQRIGHRQREYWKRVRTIVCLFTSLKLLGTDSNASLCPLGRRAALPG